MSRTRLGRGCWGKSRFIIRMLKLEESRTIFEPGSWTWSRSLGSRSSSSNSRSSWTSIELENNQSFNLRLDNSTCSVSLLPCPAPPQLPAHPLALSELRQQLGPTKVWQCQLTSPEIIVFLCIEERKERKREKRRESSFSLVSQKMETRRRSNFDRR